MRVAMADPSAFTLPYDHHLCQALSNLNVEMELFTTSDINNQNWNTNYQRTNWFYNITNHIWPASTNSRFRLALKGTEHLMDMTRFLWHIRTMSFDIIHFQWAPLPIFDQLIAFGAERSLPTILTVHDTTPYRNTPSSALQRLASHRVLAYFDALIVHTEYSKNELIRQGVEESKITVVPHGVFQKPSEVDGTESPPSREEFVLLFFGTLKNYKGIDTLIRSLAELDDEVCQRLTVRIVGKPEMDIEPLQSLSEQLDVDRLIDWQPGFVPEEKVPQLFIEADAIVLPYHHIDQSGVLMQALPYGLPVIATDVGGISETITDGIHGRLVPPQEPMALAAAISEVLCSRDYDHMVHEVTKLANETHSWSRIAEQTCDVYRSLL